MNATKATVKGFLRNNIRATLSTVNIHNHPVSSVVCYLYENDKIYFASKSETYKVENIYKNPNIALTVIDDIKPIAVNIMGVANIIKDITEVDGLYKRIGLRSRMQGEIPPITKLERGEFVIVEIYIDHMQYSDFTDKYSSPIYNFKM